MRQCAPRASSRPSQCAARLGRAAAITSRAPVRPVPSCRSTAVQVQGELSSSTCLCLARPAAAFRRLLPPSPQPQPQLQSQPQSMCLNATAARAGFEFEEDKFHRWVHAAPLDLSTATAMSRACVSVLRACTAGRSSPAPPPPATDPQSTLLNAKRAQGVPGQEGALRPTQAPAGRSQCARPLQW